MTKEIVENSSEIVEKPVETLKVRAANPYKKVALRVPQFCADTPIGHLVDPR